MEKSDHRRHTLRLLPEHRQLRPNFNVGAVQRDVQDGQRGARVVAELVREPHPLRGRVVEVAWPVRVLAPHEAEHQPARTEMVHRPWLDIIQFDQLETANSEPAC